MKNLAGVGTRGLATPIPYRQACYTSAFGVATLVKHLRRLLVRTRIHGSLLNIQRDCSIIVHSVNVNTLHRFHKRRCSIVHSVGVDAASIPQAQFSMYNLLCPVHIITTYLSV